MVKVVGSSKNPTITCFNIVSLHLSISGNFDTTRQDGRFQSTKMILGTVLRVQAIHANTQGYEQGRKLYISPPERHPL